MNELLGFTLEYRPHSPGHEIAWLVNARGVRRRASPEEEALWKLCVQLSAQLEARAKAKAK